MCSAGACSFRSGVCAVGGRCRNRRVIEAAPCALQPPTLFISISNPNRAVGDLRRTLKSGAIPVHLFDGPPLGPNLMRKLEHTTQAIVIADVWRTLGI